MNRGMKIVIGILLLILVVLGAEVVVYFKLKGTLVNNPVVSSQPVAKKSGFAQATGNTLPGLVEIKGFALIGNLNLVDVKKTEVETWAKTAGAVVVPAYSGPIPTLPPELATFSAGIKIERPTQVSVLAGYFKSISGNTLIIVDASKDKESKVTFSSGARLLIKESDKLRVASTKLLDLMANNTLSQFLKVNDLVLIPGLNFALVGQDLVIFR